MDVNNTDFLESENDTDKFYNASVDAVSAGDVIHNITYLGSEIKRSNIEFAYLVIGFGMSTILAIVIMAYMSRLSKIPDHLYNTLAFEHLGVEYLHLLSLVLYNSNLNELLNDIIKDFYSTFDTIIPFSTFCLAGIAFLKLFLFPNGEQIYSKKEIAVFSTTALSLIELYEYLFIYSNSLISDDDEEDANFDAALKLTSIFLIMAVPIAITGLILFTLTQLNSAVPKLKAIFFSVHLLIFILNDILLVVFNLAVNGQVHLIWYILFVIRIIVEGVWFMLCNGVFAGFLEY